MKYFKVVHNIQVYVRQKFKKPGACYMVAKLNEKDANLMEAGLVVEVTESEYYAWLKERNSSAIKDTNPVAKKIAGPVSVGSQEAEPKEPAKAPEASKPEPSVEKPKEPIKAPEAKKEAPKEGDKVKPGYDEFGPIKNTKDYKSLSKGEKSRLGKLRKARDTND